MSLTIDDLKSIRELVVQPVEAKLSEFREDLSCHLSEGSKRMDKIESDVQADRKRIGDLEGKWKQLLAYGALLATAITLAINWFGDWFLRKIGIRK